MSTDPESPVLDSDSPRPLRNPGPLSPGLYLVATPIGNLEDLSFRAVRVLREADRIACEDTRQTSKLLHAYGIDTPTVSYHAHNEAERSAALLPDLLAGARIALVSDAGTPAISDPGAVLVRECLTAGVPVIPIPGANAALNALIASGLATDRFRFNGFLPSRAGERHTLLEALRNQPDASSDSMTTEIWYEAPHRILDTLADLEAVFGPAQPVVLARELTKLHEEFLRGTIAQVRETLVARESIRGEFVVLLTPAPEKDTSAATLSIADSIRALLASGLSEKDALKQVARDRNLGKSDVYREWQRSRPR